MSYTKEFIELLESVYGDGFLSVGGEDSIEKIFSNIPLKGKKILDFGCGVGGTALYLAKHFECEVIGFDISADIIKEAKKKSENVSVKGSVNFVCDQNLEMFPKSSFDIVFAKESLLHVRNKKNIFKKIYQLLNGHGSQFIIYEWFKKQATYSALMKKFLKFDGLDIFLITPELCQKMLLDIGFKKVDYKDDSQNELRETLEVVRRLNTDLLGKLASKYGAEYIHKYCIPSWKMQAEVIKKGELLIGKMMAMK